MASHQLAPPLSSVQSGLSVREQSFQGGSQSVFLLGLPSQWPVAWSVRSRPSPCPRCLLPPEPLAGALPCSSDVPGVPPPRGLCQPLSFAGMAPLSKAAWLAPWSSFFAQLPARWAALTTLPRLAQSRFSVRHWLLWSACDPCFPISVLASWGRWWSACSGECVLPAAGHSWRPGSRRCSPPALCPPSLMACSAVPVYWVSSATNAAQLHTRSLCAELRPAGEASVAARSHLVLPSISWAAHRAEVSLATPSFWKCVLNCFLQASLLMNVNVTGTTALTTSLDLCDSAEDNFILLSVWSTLQVNIKVNCHIEKWSSTFYIFLLRKMKLLPLKWY